MSDYVCSLFCWCSVEMIDVVSAFARFFGFLLDAVVAGLKDGVTDSGISALASAGCGGQLTLLSLWCEWLWLCAMLVLWAVWKCIDFVCVYGCCGVTPYWMSEM